MGRIWESINASNEHMLTHVPNGQIAGSPLCCLRVWPAELTEMVQYYSS